MKKLYVLYDAEDDFALRCYAWLTAQPTVWPLEFVPFQAPELTARFAGIDDSGSERIHHLLPCFGGLSGPVIPIIGADALAAGSARFQSLIDQWKETLARDGKTRRLETRLAAAISGFDFGAKAHALSMNRTNSESTRPSKARSTPQSRTLARWPQPPELPQVLVR